MWRQMLCAMWQISVAARLSPLLEHQEEENIWQVTKLCGEKGKPKKEKKCKQLFVYFFVNLWVTVCMCTFVCVCA